jgi:hypothetical protein
VRERIKNDLEALYQNRLTIGIITQINPNDLYFENFKSQLFTMGFEYK